MKANDRVRPAEYGADESWALDRSCPMARRASRRAVLAAAMALLGGAAGAAAGARQLPEPLNEGSQLEGSITDRDNTRVGGTIYDADGKPLPDVDIWVANDASPSQRMRTRSRKTGSYLARGLGPLYTERDVQGIVLRVTFELPGYEPVAAKIAVEKNELGTLYPILLRAGEESAAADRLAVSLRGVVSASNGKPARGATVRVRADADPQLAAETVTAKDGSYELLLWNAPTRVQLEVVSQGEPALRREVVFDPPQRRDLVELATLDLRLGDS